MTKLPYNDVSWMIANVFRARRPASRRHRLRIYRAGVAIDLFAPVMGTPTTATGR